MSDQDPSSAWSHLDPHIAAALQRDAARRLEAAATAHAEAEPITPLDVACITKHVYYTALVRAGFPEDQALYLVKDGT